MLIFQLRLSHVIPNSMLALSHYFSKGSISISTCMFDGFLEDKTAFPRMIVTLFMKRLKVEFVKGTNLQLVKYLSLLLQSLQL